MPDAVQPPVRRGPDVPGVDGTAIATWDHGGSGRPLLLVHATGLCARAFDPLAADLATGHRCWSMDIRGHGASGHPASRRYDDWSILAGDVLAVVDRLALAGGVAVGHSVGGALLLLAEQRRPGTFAALYVFEPIVIGPGRPPAPDDPEPRLSVLAAKRRAGFASRRAAADNYSSKLPFSRFHPTALAGYVDHGLRDTGDGRVTLCCAPEEEASVYRGAPHHDAYDRLGEVGVPVTVAGAAGGGDLPATLVDELAGRLPHGRSQPVDGVSHFGPLEDPALIAEGCRTAFAAADRGAPSTETVPPPR